MPSSPLNLAAFFRIYPPAAELLATLRLCYDSLLSTGDVHVANAHLLDVLRQVGGPQRAPLAMAHTRLTPARRASSRPDTCALPACVDCVFLLAPPANAHASLPSPPPLSRPAPLACSCASWTSGRRA